MVRVPDRKLNSERLNVTTGTTLVRSCATLKLCTVGKFVLGVI